MRYAELLRMARWMLLASIAPAAWAQDSLPVVPVVPTAAATPSVAATAAPVAGAAATGAASAALMRRTAPGTPWPKRTVWFSREKPVLGLPLDSSKSRAHCSTDSTVFYDLSTGSAADVTAAPQLVSISTDGEVKHLLRKLPIGFDDVYVRDFFAGDQTLVTLLEARKRADGTDASPPREVDSFLSLSDYEGDLSSLVELRLRFKPVRIARFGSGDILMLGWDEGNLLPMLALLKEDGTVRRFYDLDEHKSDAAHGSDAAMERTTLEELQGALFVPYGNEVLLTYPETTKPVRVLSAAGESRTIPISLPGGYVLHDVLVSSGSRGLIVVRAQAVKDPSKAKDDAAEPVQKLFEFDSTHGTLIDELAIAKPRVADVTCAASAGLTAIFYDTIANPDHTDASANGNSSGTTDVPTQLVVATLRR